MVKCDISVGNVVKCDISVGNVVKCDILKLSKFCIISVQFAGHGFVLDIPRPLPRRPPQIDRGVPSRQSIDLLESYDDSITYNGNSLHSLHKTGMTFAEPGKTPRKKKGRTQRKARHVEISDMEEGATGGDSPEAVTPFEPSSYNSNNCK